MTNDKKIHSAEYNIKDLNNTVMHQQDSIDKFHTTIQNIVHIGTDVRYQEYAHSWAVVCIEGKTNIVKFVDLNNSNAMDILKYLKQYEAGRHCIDTPYKEIFYDGLFKF